MKSKQIYWPHGILILLIVGIILISGCIQTDDKESGFRSNTTPQDSQRHGCDGICDDFERYHPESPCYKPDCLGISGETQPQISPSGFQPQIQEISVKTTGSNYKTVSTSKPSGWFKTGQEADIMLSGFGFNNAGGSLIFNHPGGITTDGTHLILADRNNNRVLIWNSLPEGNVEPDIVLGQPDFRSNNPGSGLDNFNWPVSVATDGQHIFVADTYNHRILIWNNFPTENGQPADISLQGSETPGPDEQYANIGWPWAVWTNGEKLVVTSTHGSTILIWNNIPSENDQSPDITIQSDDFGTPRSIGSDGTNLIIGDHNAFHQDRGNFFWKTFPKQNNQKYDFFMKNAPKEGKDIKPGEIMWGPTFTEDGKVILLSDKLYIWNRFPENENDAPDISIGSSGSMGYDFWSTQGGDGSGIAYANGKLYISLCNGNKVVGYNSLPTEPDQKPDFVIGAPDIYTNTLETEFIISNPMPATNGESLFVSSDFDKKLYVWKELPDEEGARPDFVYSNLEEMWDNALNGNVLVLAGKQIVYIWKTLPLNEEMPDLILRNKIGSVSFKSLKGVAIDDRYFYLADEEANKIYVWEGIPDENSEPSFSIDIEGPLRLSSNGKYLAALSGPENTVFVFEVDKLPDVTHHVLQKVFNLPQGVFIYENSLFVADTNNNIVHIWNNIEDAIDGKTADIILGEKSLIPQIGKDKLFWPAGLAFDGSYLWVGEFKFSERLLRFSVK